MGDDGIQPSLSLTGNTGKRVAPIWAPKRVAPIWLVDLLPVEAGQALAELGGRFAALNAMEGLLDLLASPLYSYQ